ncbi:MAG: hypothetical protein ACI4NE_08005 [Succinivibrio sp.]
MSNTNNISQVSVDLITRTIPAGCIEAVSFNNCRNLLPDRYPPGIDSSEDLNVSFLKKLKESVLCRFKALAFLINRLYLYAQAYSLKLRSSAHISYAMIMKLKESRNHDHLFSKFVKSRIYSGFILRNIFTISACNTVCFDDSLIGTC